MTEAVCLPERIEELADNAAALRRTLRSSDTRSASAMAMRITTARSLSDSALSLVVHLSQQPTATTVEGLHALGHLAQVATTTQDAATQLTAALTQAIEHHRTAAHADCTPAVVTGPSPRQHLLAAENLLARIPGACSASAYWLTTAKSQRPASDSPTQPTSPPPTPSATAAQR
ncbi:hypothetical protein ACWCXK_05900 [Streptomyces sp. NPDC001739]